MDLPDDLLNKLQQFELQASLAGFAGFPEGDKVTIEVLVTGINNAGVVCFDKKKYEEAKYLLEKALMWRIILEGVDNNKSVNVEYNLACVLVCQSNFLEAKSHFAKALECRVKVLGDTDPLTLATRNGLGSCLVQLKEYGEAKEHFETVFRCKEKVLGIDHEATLNASSTLAISFAYLKEYDKSIAIFEKTIAGREKVLGVDHKDTLSSVHNLGTTIYSKAVDILDQKERLDLLDRVQFHLEKAFNGREKTLGPESSDTIDSLQTLGNLIGNMGKFKESEEILLKALQRAEKAFGKEHKMTIKISENIKNLKGFSKAATFFGYAIAGAIVAALYGISTLYRS